MPTTITDPKPRNLKTKVITLARADNATVKTVLPKDAVITGVNVIQTAIGNAGTPSYTVSAGDDADGILNAYGMSTAVATGYYAAGAGMGSSVGTKLTVDSPVKSTFTAGTSASGATGYAFIHYFMAGPGEGITS